MDDGTLEPPVTFKLKHKLTQKAKDPFESFPGSRAASTDNLPKPTLLNHFINSIPLPTLSLEEEEDEFLLARLEVKTVVPRSIIPSWITSLQQTFKSSMEAAELGPDDNLEFWGGLINDYERQIRMNPRMFKRQLYRGIPDPIRGMLWQLMSNSKSEELEQEYLSLTTKTSKHEKIIERDLARTFPQHPFFKDPEGHGQHSLFLVLKAYSLYDPEIGYCQGIAFVVGPLLLNMPEEQVFCVVVKLMFDYGFRQLYTPKMLGLHIRNHQFDRLLAIQFPLVAAHLNNLDIQSSAFASQWFMTLFAYRFPLELVFRILDIVFAEGAESVLRFALALIKHNQEKILSLDFEPLLEFLKMGLFDIYTQNPNNLVVDAQQIRISKKQLDSWEAEYLENVRLANQLRKASPDYLECEQLRQDNRQMVEYHKHLEQLMDAQAKKIMALTEQLMTERNLCSEATEMVSDLEEQVTGLKSLLSDKQHDAYVEELSAKNMDLILLNGRLEEQLAKLEAENTRISLVCEASEAQKLALADEIDFLKITAEG